MNEFDEQFCFLAYNINKERMIIVIVINTIFANRVDAAMILYCTAEVQTVHVLLRGTRQFAVG